MTTHREQILVKVAAALQAAATAWPGGAANFARNRLAAITPAKMPFVLMWDGGMTVSTEGDAGVRRFLSVEIECHLKGASGVAVGAAVSEAHGEIVKAMAGLLDDEPFTDLASDVIEGETTDPEFDFKQRQGHMAAFATKFEITFETAEGDPSANP